MNLALSEPVLKLNQKESLTSAEMNEAMEAIVTGQVPDAQIEEFLLRLREKGETVEEIVAAAKVMRKYAVKFSKHYSGLLDTCGTGGDQSHTLNVSTLASLVAAAGGLKVAKHGNRSISSVSGSADLLEALGIPLTLSVEKVEACLQKTGFCFLFAPNFHPAMRHVMAARRKIQGKTIFNILGPLSNPAEPDYQVIGVYHRDLLQVVAEVLCQLGTKRSLVLHSEDGLDEISICAATFMKEVSNGKIKDLKVEPEDFETKGKKYRVRASSLHNIQFHSKEQLLSASIQIIKGGFGESWDADHIVCANAAAAFYVAGKAKSFRDGFERADHIIADRTLEHKVKQIKEFCFKVS